FMLTPSASADAILDCGENVFQLCFKDTNQGFASADYFAAKFPEATIGVIYDSSDVYSAGIYEKFAAQAEANGLNIACVEAFTADNKADLTTQVTKCKDAGCDLVFLPFYATEAAQVLTYANTIDYSPIFQVLSVVVLSDTVFQAVLPHQPSCF
ncbi:MAG: ABC transporter substrate-binding protein, partial [Peptococcaceae bacterium]|nr:ABC transporter substrate-binding protein [Peptococcaceae bacterium]